MSKPKLRENQIACPKPHSQSLAKLGCTSRSALRQRQGPSQQSPRSLGSETVSWGLSHGAGEGKVTVIPSQAEGEAAAGGSSQKEYLLSRSAAGQPLAPQPVNREVISALTEGSKEAVLTQACSVRVSF